MEKEPSRKSKRIEKKKKKVEAFLRLAAENDADRIANVKVSAGFDRFLSRTLA